MTFPPRRAKVPGFLISRARGWDAAEVKRLRGKWGARGKGLESLKITRGQFFTDRAVPDHGAVINITTKGHNVEC